MSLTARIDGRGFTLQCFGFLSSISGRRVTSLRHSYVLQYKIGYHSILCDIDVIVLACMDFIIFYLQLRKE